MEETKQATTEMEYELRGFTADDIFPMLKILSKIGVKNFKRCFDSQEVRQAIAEMAADGKKNDQLDKVGMIVMLDIADIIFTNVSNCKEEIYFLLSQLSGMTKKQIAGLPAATFANMIVDTLQKEDFRDFFAAASRLLK